ncbi:transglycosylase domain-containing protein [Actinomadura macrotermitis]|uniref:Penicillin-binding protein 1A n=1 Tax=Actinomadura macrotermitis TaxID=2585200 RepID=A0A7K0BVW7_9ACTN|nr:transglycosylase domain-containing protein [Actinomadura macrotermitis]MQY05311.1 Penicillin-binding protein 1A [Actinomadura macrotermitis]
MLAIFAVLLLGFSVLVAVAYANTPVPKGRQATAIAQESVIYYRDGKTPLARIGMHREDVELDDVPKHVQNAVLAAEDRKFWDEPGVSPTGVARALYKTATGGEVQGGSTITQQLARNYYAGLSQKRSVDRKLKEILISIRLGQEVDKKEILKLYLNTVSFGRQAYGIKTAARAYFRKELKKLTVSEAAMLAAMIQRPSFFATRGDDSNPAYRLLVERWNYVLNGMVTMKWLTPEDRARQKFPTTVKQWSDVSDNGQTGYIKQRVLDELKSKFGIDDKRLELGGLKITTTFDKDLTDYTAQMIKQVRREKGLKNDIRFGLAAVTPDGEVRAAYGGPNYVKQPFNNSFQGKIAPGSSFKPIVLATALKNGVSLQNTLDGSYSRSFGGPKPITNDSRSENGVYNLVQMTQMSINTAYVDLGQKVGLDKVVETAKEMGIPADTTDLRPGVVSLPLGPIDVSPVNMASVYSTFASGGDHTDVHVISKIVDAGGKKLKLPWKTKNVFNKQVAGDATKAMRAVVTSGTGKQADLGARPVAGKTGTTDENKSAWFVGYAPEQLATSVAMWRQDKHDTRLSLQGIGGYSQIYGGTIPADIFRRFMLKALEGEEIKPLFPPGNVGELQPWAVPKKETKATPTPSTTPTPPCRPGQETSEDKPCRPSEPPTSPTTPTSPTVPTSPTPPTKTPCQAPGFPPGCVEPTPTPKQPGKHDQQRQTTAY